VFVVTVGPLITAPTRSGSGMVIGTRIRSTGPGSVVMLDAHSGRVLRTVQVGVVPGAVAVDTGGGHVFVMNAAGVEPLSSPPMASLSAPGGVSVLDAGRGTVRRTIPLPLGKGLSMMALDARAGRWPLNYAASVNSACAAERRCTQPMRLSAMP
jgi:DNA-binding beta-propeller fold protein YncE